MKARALGMIPPILLLALATGAGALSLYPDRSERDRLVELDGLEPRQARLVLSHWRPYGLPGVSLESLTLKASIKGLGMELGAVQEDWGVIRSWRLRGSLLAQGSLLRLGIAGSRAVLVGGRSAGKLDLLASSGVLTVLSLRLPLAGEKKRNASRLGLSRRFGAWTLRIWTHGNREGIALAWRAGPLGLEWLGEGESWQGLAVEYGRGHWTLRLEERLHPWLGASHGLRLGLR